MRKVCSVLQNYNGPGGVAGQVGPGGGPVGGGAGLAGQGGGWPGGRRGMDLRSKECSGVDIVT